jgi:uncharacterized membrane protein YhaH (DUF805 family)
MASYPALEDWFDTSIRRNRKSFVIATLALSAIIFSIMFILAWFVKPSKPQFFWVLAPFAIAYVICSYMLTAQRLRDMGLTGWLALLWIPVNLIDRRFDMFLLALAAYIVLCSVPGTQGPNRYGPDPLQGTPATPQRRPQPVSND